MTLSPPFNILVVCTANQCRSPLVEHLLQVAVQRRGLHWSITSAGTHARPGAPMDGRTAAFLESIGVETHDWGGSRLLQKSSLADMQLVLTATTEHRRRVVSLEPRAIRHTFTIKQFAGLTAASKTTFTSGPELLSAVRISRSAVQPPRPIDLDLADPVGRSFKEYERCYQESLEAVEQTLGQYVISRDQHPLNENSSV